WTRGPWLAFFTAFIVVIGIKFLKLRKLDFKQSSRIITTVVFSFLVVFGMIYGSMQSEPLINKIKQDYQVVEQIFDGEVDKIPKTSLGWRVRMNIFAWNKFWERPIFGWGPYVKQVIDNSNLGSPWGHLHNSYWEVLLRFGIVGGILFGAGIIWLLRGVWLDYRNHPDQEPILLGIYGAFVVLSVWALIDYKFTGWENTAFIWLLAGAAASRALRAKFESSVQ
ncbi:MAG: O-antigen ligase family protein, partial [Gammaproteobacteria bacterium]|nr:O-antigen ligase family protein [Gammaproteobacteria bacterium]